MKSAFKDIAKDPGSYVMLIVFALVVLGAVYVLLTAGVENWRYMYCSASEAHAIECTVKGWW